VDIRFPDRRCLTPRLLDADGATTLRLEGVLDGAGPDGTLRPVDTVDYDGRRCRHRIVGGGREPRWLIEDDAHAFRSYARIVVDGLRRLCREGGSCPRRFPDGPPSRALARRLESVRHAHGGCSLTVLDTCVTADGRLWLRAAIDDVSGTAKPTGAGPPVAARAGGPRVEGWWLLADPSSGDEPSGGNRPSEAPRFDRGAAGDVAVAAACPPPPNHPPRRQAPLRRVG